jgi:hypothetical protein
MVMPMPRALSRATIRSARVTRSSRNRASAPATRHVVEVQRQQVDLVAAHVRRELGAGHHAHAEALAGGNGRR